MYNENYMTNRNSLRTKMKYSANFINFRSMYNYMYNCIGNVIAPPAPRISTRRKYDCNNNCTHHLVR